jgi:hypothetical protein
LAPAPPVTQFETCGPVQIKRPLAERTTYREQRAIIMSHGLTPNTNSWPSSLLKNLWKLSRCGCLAGFSERH